MNPMLSFKQFQYYISTKKILKEVNLEFYPGECVCIQGHNGAGKSSLLHSLSKHQSHIEGDLYFQNKKIKNNVQRLFLAQNCSYLGHKPGLFYDMSIEQNLIFFSKIFGKENQKEKDFLLEVTKLKEHKNKLTRKLSHGMKQKLALARFFLHPASIFLLDEPLNALDTEGQEIFYFLFQHYFSNKHLALIVSHAADFYIEKKLISRFLFLREGQIIADIKAEKYHGKVKEKVKKLLYN